MANEELKHWYLFILEEGSKLTDDPDFLVTRFYPLEIAMHIPNDDVANSLEEFGAAEMIRQVKADANAYKMFELMTRFNPRMTGPLLVKVAHEMTSEELETYINFLSRDELRKFIREAKV